MPIEFAPRRRHSLSLTPLIDVVFNLLLFFMLASSLMDWRGLDIATGIAEGNAADSEPLEVQVLGDGRLRHQDKTLSAESLARTLAADAGDGAAVSIILRADDDVPLAHLVSAFDTFGAHGLTALALGPGEAQR
jgi:biopolymer transport protein ExbD